MKSILIFYDEKKSLYKNEKSFDGKSSVDLSMNWANSLKVDKIVTISEKENLTELLNEMVSETKKNNADYVIFSFNDLPFLNLELTNKMIEYHTTYHAEYTFADGYSKGLSPEIIDSGTLSILYELSKNEKNSQDKNIQKITRESIFNLIKTDINAFEIETVLSDTDFRLLRYNFDCSNKLNYLTCKNLFDAAKELKFEINNCHPDELNKIACESVNVLKTIPSFYNIQISDKCSGKCNYCPYPKAYKNKNNSDVENANKFMTLEKAEILLEKIYSFSENAVISFSLWGEAFSNPDLFKILDKALSYKSFAVFIETDGMFINDDSINKLKQIIANNYENNTQWPKIMIAVSLDAFTDQMYKKIRGTEKSIEDAKKIIEKLNSVIPGNVYPQFVRMNQNEQELESFFRYWKEENNQSGGEFIIQKYDNFAGELSSEKTADLTPIQRNICWHLRRDMNILTNGDVVLCKEYILDNIIGNVFEKDLDKIWQCLDKKIQEHLNNNFDKKCGECDEFYTYNF